MAVEDARKGGVMENGEVRSEVVMEVIRCNLFSFFSLYIIFWKTFTPRCETNLRFCCT